MRPLLTLACALALTCTAVCPAPAQAPPRASADRGLTYWSIDIAAATVSALLQARRGERSVPRILAAGVTGGTLIYAGQRVIGLREPGLRFAGLQLVAVGASMTGNIARAQGPIDQLTLPVFPLYVQLQTRPDASVRVRLSTLALISSIRLGATYRRPPDLAASLAAGTPVFAVPREWLQCLEHDGVTCLTQVAGQHLFGAVAYATDGEACLSHELGHVAQDIRDAVLFAVPANDLVLPRAGPVGRWLSRFLVLDGALPLMLLNGTIGESEPGCSAGSYYECEVNHLTRLQRR